MLEVVPVPVPVPGFEFEFVPVNVAELELYYGRKPKWMLQSLLLQIQ